MTETTPLASPSRAPCVVIVGRPNVGKSTLFNRLVGKRRAIVHDRPGMTRDRLEGSVEWLGHQFTLIDTGGYEPDSQDAIGTGVQAQTITAKAGANTLLFVVDARQGTTSLDEAMALDLQRQNQSQVILVINKAEGDNFDDAEADFVHLGLARAFAVSAEHGEGIGELLDAVIESLDGVEPVAVIEETEDRPIRLAIVGRPNVGKSLLFNRLTGHERAIVSSVPGTTRDSVDLTVEVDGTTLQIVDTAGLTRKGRTARGPAVLSSVMTRKTIEKADVVAFVADGSEPLGHQDAVVAGLAQEAGAAIVVVLNKWDLVANAGKTRPEIMEDARETLKFLSWAPVMTVSAKVGSGLRRFVRTVRQVNEAAMLQIGTAELNRFVERELEEAPFRLVHGRRARVMYATQIRKRPPTFIFHLNRVTKVHFSTQRFIENRLRQHFALAGTPVKLIFRAQSKR